MIVKIRVGVGRPEAVDLEAVKAEAVQGGLDVEMLGETPIIAQAVVTVSYNLEGKS